MTVGRLLAGAAVLSVVAVSAPAALAAERPDDRGGPIGVGATVVLMQSEQTPLAPWTADAVVARSDLEGPVTAVVLRPDDRAAARGPGAIAAPPSAAPIADVGTDWSDPVAVGLVAAIFALLGVTAVYLVEHGRKHTGAGPRGTGGTPAAVR